MNPFNKQTAKTHSLLLIGVLSGFLISCGTTERTAQNHPKQLPVQDINEPSHRASDSTSYDYPEDLSPNGLVNLEKSDVEAVELVEEGRASWYGPKFHGRLTANGEEFDMNGMTAAHRTLPFNTLVLVKNQDTGKSVLVRINDRGPFAKNRIIDLSREAAKKVGMIGPGTARVELYVPKKALDQSESTNLTVPTYTVQLGSFDTEAKAFNHAGKIKGSRVEIVRRENKTLYRVYYGMYIDRNEAHRQQRKLERRNFSGFVKQLENS